MDRSGRRGREGERLHLGQLRSPTGRAGARTGTWPAWSRGRRRSRDRAVVDRVAASQVRSASSRPMRVKWRWAGSTAMDGQSSMIDGVEHKMLGAGLGVRHQLGLLGVGVRDDATDVVVGVLGQHVGHVGVEVDPQEAAGVGVDGRQQEEKRRAARLQLVQMARQHFRRFAPRPGAIVTCSSPRLSRESGGGWAAPDRPHRRGGSRLCRGPGW